MDPVTTDALATVAAAPEISFVHLFMQAGFVVKFVMICLMFASFWCWAIIFSKGSQLKLTNFRASRFEYSFYETASLEELYRRLGDQPKDPHAAAFVAAMKEWQLSSPRLAAGMASPASLLERVERSIHATTAREMERLGRGLATLASIGSGAPFVGLFGTVWGIMSSFQSIAAAKNTSLAVVAPGIAEALLATAIGLVAAIPAMIAYNKFSNDIDRYQVGVEAFGQEVITAISRRLEQQG
jgi:biopolymer transport protein TolQ